jgi:alkanesulfonate monooxygenase SsuD/methylene tetrahydromethanopterin reductase-like flavin-dependent oxidoreductase (luciferase family)
VELGVHLPLIEFADEGQSLARLTRAVDAARDCGLPAVAANDHFVFQAPWLDGPTALAAVVERAGAMDLVTTVALPVLRGPVPLAKALAALDVLCDGRVIAGIGPVIAGIGPGSSERDYEAVGVPFGERWQRFDEAAATLGSLLGDAIPLWIASWGSEAGLKRVARLGDGWLASAYNTTPEAFGAAKGSLPDRFPSALSTMWMWITEDAREADRMLGERLAPLIGRQPDRLREQVCVGAAEKCAELLARYAEAGCGRVFLWPLGDEPRQIELAAATVLPAVDAATRA